MEGIYRKNGERNGKRGIVISWFNGNEKCLINNGGFNHLNNNGLNNNNGSNNRFNNRFNNRGNIEFKLCKNMNVHEKPLHRLIKTIVYENPTLFCSNPYITASEVSLRLDGEDSNTLGVIDVMILENDFNKLKGTFIEVKSSYSIKRKVEELKKNRMELNEYLKQIAKHMAALSCYFNFSDSINGSKYILVYPLKEREAIEEFYNEVTYMYKRNNSDNGFSFLMNEIDKYIGAIEIRDSNISIIKIKTMERIFKKTLHLFKRYAGNAHISKILNIAHVSHSS